MNKFSITIEVDDQELWEATFGTAGESWSHWTGLEFLGDTDWDKIGRVRLEILNPDDEMGMPISKEVGIEDVRAAIQKILNERKCADPCTGRFPVGEGMSADWDACTSDLVLQTMVLGEVVYG